MTQSRQKYQVHYEDQQGGTDGISSLMFGPCTIAEAEALVGPPQLTVPRLYESPDGRKWAKAALSPAGSID